jgi:hypothetical protein
VDEIWLNLLVLVHLQHLFALFITAAGRLRRLDIIGVPNREFAFANIGWTGSKQYCRFLRRYVPDVLKMHLNSHFLMRVTGAQVRMPFAACRPIAGQNAPLLAFGVHVLANHGPAQQHQRPTAAKHIAIEIIVQGPACTDRFVSQRGGTSSCQACPTD